MNLCSKLFARASFEAVSEVSHPTGLKRQPMGTHHRWPLVWWWSAHSLSDVKMVTFFSRILQPSMALWCSISIAPCLIHWKEWTTSCDFLKNFSFHNQKMCTLYEWKKVPVYHPRWELHSTLLFCNANHSVISINTNLEVTLHRWNKLFFTTVR